MTGRLLGKWPVHVTRVGYTLRLGTPNGRTRIHCGLEFCVSEGRRQRRTTNCRWAFATRGVLRLFNAIMNEDKHKNTSARGFAFNGGQPPIAVGTAVARVHASARRLGGRASLPSSKTATSTANEPSQQMPPEQRAEAAPAPPCSFLISRFSVAT